MSAIQASSAGVKDMADGSLRITFEFDPRYAKDAYALFGARGTSCAIAALTQAASTQAARKETIQEPKERAGVYRIMACKFSKDVKFHEWLNTIGYSGVTAEGQARAAILDICNITSRKDLDSSDEARHAFLTQVRTPFFDWREG